MPVDFKKYIESKLFRLIMAIYCLLGEWYHLIACSNKNPHCRVLKHPVSARRGAARRDGGDVPAAGHRPAAGAAGAVLRQGPAAAQRPQVGPSAHPLCAPALCLCSCLQVSPSHQKKLQITGRRKVKNSPSCRQRGDPSLPAEGMGFGMGFATALGTACPVSWEQAQPQPGKLRDNTTCQVSS